MKDRQTESISTYRLGPSIGWAEWKVYTYTYIGGTARNIWKLYFAKICSFSVVGQFWIAHAGERPEWEFWVDWILLKKSLTIGTFAAGSGRRPPDICTTFKLIHWVSSASTSSTRSGWEENPYDRADPRETIFFVFFFLFFIYFFLWDNLLSRCSLLQPLHLHQLLISAHWVVAMWPNLRISEVHTH